MCTSPLWIRNRRYYKPGITFEEIAVQLAEHPGDLARQRLLVPCGKCEECLRDERNAWYVRLERELARCPTRVKKEDLDDWNRTKGRVHQG